ncbi:hypothetical protein EBU95_15910, partial [bacterium]|nr:hypothetical protein [bacterium]
KNLKDRIPGAVTKEFLYDSVHQLNADPHLDVWGVFTGLVSVHPCFQFTVTAIQIVPPPATRISRPRLNLPDGVVKGLVERAVAQAAFSLPSIKAQDWNTGKSKGIKEYLKDLVEASKEEIESLLLDSAPSHAIEASRSQIERELKKVVDTSLKKKSDVGKNFFSIKQNIESDTLKRIRKYGSDYIFMTDLSSNSFLKLKNNWKPDLESFNLPSYHVSGFPVWQCGGSLYAVGPKDLEGKQVPFN